METGVIQINFKDGRVYRVFFANATQQQKIVRWCYDNEKLLLNWEVPINGIHTTKQFLNNAEKL